MIPTHQGRAVEKILFRSIGQGGSNSAQQYALDTTRANVEFTVRRPWTWSSLRDVIRRRGTRSGETWTSQH